MMKMIKKIFAPIVERYRRVVQTLKLIREFCQTNDGPY